MHHEIWDQIREQAVPANCSYPPEVVRRIPETSERARAVGCIELLWRSLASFPEQVPSPEWHGHVLAERLSKIERGEGKFLTLAEVKRRFASDSLSRSFCWRKQLRTCGERAHLLWPSTARRRRLLHPLVAYWYGKVAGYHAIWLIAHPISLRLYDQIIKSTDLTSEVWRDLWHSQFSHKRNSWQRSCIRFWMDL